MNPSNSPPTHPAFRKSAYRTEAAGANTRVAGFTASDDSKTLLDWTAALIDKARRETSLVRSERMLSFVKARNDTLTRI